jgi:hypothetical protein
VVCIHSVWLKRNHSYSTASNEAYKRQSPREQVYPYAPKRASGSYFPVLPRIQILAI